MKSTEGQFVVGFVMDYNGRRVALLRKQRPEWQKDLLNGCGGRVELGETFEQAMIREAREELGLRTMEAFEHVLTLRRGAFECRFFRMFSTSTLAQVATATDEAVEVHATSDVIGRPDLVPNLSWIVPLAIDPCVVIPLIVDDADSNGRNWRRWPLERAGV